MMAARQAAVAALAALATMSSGCSCGCAYDAEARPQERRTAQAAPVALAAVDAGTPDSGTPDSGVLETGTCALTDGVNEYWQSATQAHGGEHQMSMVFWTKDIAWRPLAGIASYGSKFYTGNGLKWTTGNPGSNAWVHYNYFTASFTLAGASALNSWRGAAEVLDGDAPILIGYADPNVEDGISFVTGSDSTTPAALTDDQPFVMVGYEGGYVELCVAEWWVALSALNASQIAAAFNVDGSPVDYRWYSANVAALAHVWRFGNNCPDATDSASTIYDCVGSADLTGYNLESADLTTADYPGGP
jgi:hypothetical protein